MATRFSTDFDELAADEQRTDGGSSIDVGRLIRLRGRLMVVVAGILSIVSVVFVWQTTPQMYTATSEIRFLSNRPSVMRADSNGLNTAAYHNYVNTQIGLITGNTVLSRVLDQPEIQKIFSHVAVEDRTAVLEGVLKAEWKRSSELVKVTCTMSEKQSAKIVLDEVIKQYRAYNASETAGEELDRLKPLQTARDKKRTELDFLQDRISEKRKDVEAAMQQGEGAAEQYREKSLQARTQLGEIQSEIQIIKRELARLDDIRKRNVENPKDPINEFGIEERVTSSSTVGSLRQGIVKAQSEIAEMAFSMTEDNPRIKSKREQLKSLDFSLAQELKKVRGEVIASIASQYDHSLTTLEQREKDKMAEAEEYLRLSENYKQESERIAQAAADQQNLMWKADQLREDLRQIDNAINEINLERDAPGRVRLAEAPVSPPREDNSRRLKLALVAFVLSCGFGVGLGLLLEVLDRRIRSSRDLSKLTRLPIIASIPHTKEDRALKDAYIPLLTQDYPDSSAADEFRRMLVQLLYPEDHSAEVKSLLVTSSTRGDGKTTVSCNLAIAMAQAGRRTLLVDLSARRPEIEKSFNLELGPGLSDILAGEIDPEDAVRLSNVPHLSVLGPGCLREKLSGQLGSRNTLQFLEWCEEHFDHVIFDAAPALLVADAKMLAPVVDGVIVVTRAGASSVGMTRRCLRELEQVGSNVIGVALNGQRMMRGGYLKENFKLYYGYGDQFEAAKTAAAATNGNGSASRYNDGSAVVLLPVDDDSGDPL